MRVVGRLRPGVSLDRARDEMRRIAAAMEQEFPATNKDWGVRLETLYDTMLDERVRPSLLVLLAAVGMVLLIACANVANMLLARGISRQRELALRTALGAGRSRLVRQLVTESVSLAVVSGTCGLLLAVFAVQTLRAMLPPTLTRIDEIDVDATVLGLGLLLSLASGLFMGLVPAVRASRVALVPSLAQQGKGVAGPSGTLAATRHRRGADGPGDDAARGCGAASAEFRPAAAGPPRVRTGRRDHREDLAAPAPSIRMRRARGLLAPTAGIARRPATGTVRGGRDHGAIRARRARGREGAGPCQRMSRRSCGDRGRGAHGESGLLSGAGRAVAGWAFVRSAGRLRGRPLVAIVSESVARQLWADKSPVGQILDWNGRQHEVVGVVGDIRGADGRGCCGGGLDREPSGCRLSLRHAVPAEDDDVAGADSQASRPRSSRRLLEPSRTSIRHSRSIRSAACTTGSTRVLRSRGSPRR